MTTAMTPTDGPIAVTGASGYIGSWIVKDCLAQGYTVRACVRDASRPEKVKHLAAMSEQGLPGKLELVEGDLFRPGSYDDAFAECSGIIHAGAAVGFNKESPREVYDGCFTEVEHVLASARKSNALKRFVFTSSFAAVGHPEPQGYVFTEKDWCSDNPEGYKGRWTEASIDTNRDIAYAMAKANTEKMIYQVAAEDGSFEAMSILPLHVIGPLMTANHDQAYSWQNCIRQMLQGQPFRNKKGGRMLWNMVDVRDVARAHRRCLESEQASNGSRYILSATDTSGEMFTWQLQAMLQEMFPQVTNVGGEEMEDGKPVKETYDSPRAYCTLARKELGLETYLIDETVRATGDSYFELGLLTLPE